MLTNRALVVIKRGDTALADVLENSCSHVGKHVKKTTVQDIKNMERDYNIMRVSHNEKIKKAMAESKVKYRRRPKPTPKPLLYLQVGYAMAVCGVQAVHKKLAKKTNRIMKILGIRSKYNSRRNRYV